MRGRARALAFIAAFGGFGLGVLAIRLLAGEAPTLADTARTTERVSPGWVSGSARIERAGLGGDRTARALAASEDRFGEPYLSAGRRRATRGVAERFLAAYARYEVGDLATARDALRETTTPEFFASLSAAPPRLPQTVRRVRRARLMTLQVTPGADARTLQITGTRVRAGHVEAYVFALVAVAGRLLVAGPAP